MATTASERTLRVVSTTGKTSTLVYDDASLRIGRQDRHVLQVPLRRVLWAEVLGGIVEVHVLAYNRTGRKAPSALSLVNVNARIHADDVGDAPQWAEDLLKAAYHGVKRRRKLRVLVNPAGGQGRARRTFTRKIEPILRAARCELDVTYTTHRNHAQEIAKELPLTFDAVLCVSGDGLLHEVFNGFAAHAFPMRAFRIPLAPIPTGSGNGTVLNLLGLEKGTDIGGAVLNALKGVPTPLDLFELTTPRAARTRTFTYMTQAVGLMADLDLGTEHLRWMGDTRFMYGFVRGIITHRACPVRLAIKVAEDDKRAMVRACEAARSATSPVACKGPKLGRPESADEEFGDDLTDEEAAKLPDLKYDMKSTDGWVEVDQSPLFVYAGQGPYVGRDLMQFPVSMMNDGLIDIAVWERGSRMDLINAMDDGEKGASFWFPNLRYYKAHAYRISPASPDADVRLSVDGEAYPFGEFQVEVHPGLGRVLSPEGQYAARFSIPPPHDFNDATNQT